MIRSYIRRRSRNIRVRLPMVLVCSQLPEAVQFPLKVTLTVLEQQAAGALGHNW